MKGGSALARTAVRLLRNFAVTSVCLAILAYAVRTERVTRWVSGRIVSRLSAATGRDVRLGELRLSLFPPGGRVKDLVIADPNGSFKTPFVRIDQAEGTLAPLSLLRGTLTVQTVDVDGVHVAWRGTEPSGAPPPSWRRPSLLRHIVLKRLNARHGSLTYRGRTTSFEMRADDLEASGGSMPCDERFCLEGLAKAGRFEVSIEDHEMAGSALSLNFRWQGGVLTFPRFSVGGARLRAEGHAAWRVASPVSGLVAGHLTASGDAARELEGGFPITMSTLEATTTVTITAGQAAVTGTGAVTGLEYPGLATASRASGTFSYRDGTVQVDLSAEDFSPTIEGLRPARGGPIKGHVTITPGHDAEVDLHAGPVPYEDLLARLDPRLPVANVEVAGDGKIAWRIGDRSSLKGEIALDVKPLPGPEGAGPGDEAGDATVGARRARVQIQGSATILVGPETLEIRDGRIETPDFSAGLAGTITPRLKTADLSASVDRVDLLPALRDLSAFPAADRALAQSLRGPARGSVDLSSSPRGVRARGRLDGEALRLGTASGEVGPFAASMDWSFHDDQLSVDRLHLKGDGWSGRGSFLLEPSRAWPLRRMKLDLASMPAAPLWSVLGLSQAQGGNLSGGAACDFDAESPRSAQGSIDLEADGVTFAGVPVTRMSLTGTVDRGLLRITSAKAATEAGDLEASGSYAPDEGTGRIDLRSGPLDVAALARAHATALGEASGSVRILGRLDVNPAATTFSGSAQGSGIAWKGLQIGEITVPSIQYGPAPAQGLDVILHAPFGGLGGTLSLPPDGESLNVDLSFENLDLADLRSLMPPGSLPGLDGAATGTIRGSVPVESPQRAVLRVDLQNLSLAAGGLVLKASDEVHLRLARGALKLDRTRFVGEGTDLAMSGVYDFTQGATGAGVMQGTFDARLLALQYPQIEARGTAAIDLTLTAAGDAISYTGSLRTSGARIDYPGSPSPAENLGLRASLDSGGKIRIEDLAFDFAGGHVTGEGNGQLQGTQLKNLEIRFAGSGMHAEPFPDLTIFFDGRARLTVAEREARLAGRLDVVRATYTRELGLEGAAKLNRVRTAPKERVQSQRTPLALDLDIIAPGDVWVRNKTAQLEGSARLKVTGTIGRPELTGRITVFENGTFRFRDVTYVSQGGGLDFDDPDNIDPLIDVRATTQVQEYEITLHVLGRYSKPRFELSSQPSLSPRDIVSLLVTGQTYSDSLALEAGAGLLAEENVGQYLTAPLSATLGKTLGKALNLTSVSLQPQFLNGRADPTARLTLTKRISPQLLFTYSNNLGSSQEQIYQFEYDLSREWQIVALRDLDASLSGNILFRHRWGGPERKPARRGASPASALNGVPIRGIHITGSPFPGDPSQRRQIHLKTGRKYSRADALQAREDLRGYLAGKGYPLASVKMKEKTVESAEGRGVRLVYDVDPGTPVSLTIDGVRHPGSFKKAVRAAWGPHFSANDLAPEGEEALRAKLGSTGHAAARIETSVQHDPRLLQIRYTVDAGPKVSVRSLQLDGVAGVPEKDLREVMSTREDRWNTSGTLRPEALDADVGALKAVYLAHGYLDARIEKPKIVFSADRSKADVEIDVDEGDVWRVGEVTIEGQGEFSRSEMKGATLLTPGTVLKPSMLTGAEERVRDLLDAHGYNSAKVRYRIEGPPAGAHITFQVEEGSKQVLQDVEIHGTRLTAKRVVEREIPLRNGDPISRASLLEIQRKLYALGLFRSVDVKTEPVSEGSSETRLIIRVEEGDPILTAVGAGYNSEEQLQGFAQIGHDNVFGTGRSVSLLLRASSINRRAQVSLADRRLFGVPFEGIATVFYEEQDHESFADRRTSGGFQFKRSLSRELTALGRYNIQDVTLLRVDPNLPAGTDLGEEDIRLASVGASVARDTRNDILSPSSGTFSTADLSLYSSALGSQRNFSRLFLSTAAFRTVGSKTVLGVSLRVGLASPFAGTSSIPLAERFFAGGDTTLRGFKLDEAGPLDPTTGKPIGGEMTLLGNVELRVPIYGALKGVLFYDTGNAFLTASDFSASGTKLLFERVAAGDCPSNPAATNCPIALQDGIRHVLGAGIRFDTPLGPLRLEYGRKLDRKFGDFTFDDGSGGRLTVHRDESPYELFVSVGQAF